MLGEQLSDPHAVEGRVREAKGLELLPIRTSFLKHKRTVRVKGELLQEHPLRFVISDTEADSTIKAYEIHMGVTQWSALADGSGYRPLFSIEADGTDSLKATEDIQPHIEGTATSDGRIWGSYLHGLFDNDVFRRSWLNGIRMKKGLMPISETFKAEERKFAEFDRVADVVRNHVDMKKIYEIIGYTH